MWKLIYLLSTLVFISSSQASFIEAEKQNQKCSDFIHDMAFSNGRYKPSLKEITDILGDKKQSDIAYTHKYYWVNVEVTFLNGKYVDHVGFLFLDEHFPPHHLITPEHIIAIYGKPLKITKTVFPIQIWQCAHLPSRLEVLINKHNHISKYFGRYCSKPNINFCKSFTYCNK